MTDQSEIRRNSQALRKGMTKEERHLWYDFLKIYPIPIHRQYPIGNYIVDFYCHQTRLVIELDGSQHFQPENMEYDRKRTEFLESQGLLVLRFSNWDVMQKFPAVCQSIDLAVSQRRRL